MAIKELFGLVQTTVPIAAATQNIHAGMLVALDSGGKAVLASRAGTAGSYLSNEKFIGLAADDAVKTGNTFIQADPVGSTKVASDGTITANNNAWFSSTKRALGDYQDETVTNVTNLTAGSTGNQGPARGLGVYMYTPGSQFIVDDLAVIATAKTDASGTDGGTATAWAPGTMFTIGVAANAGKFVELVTPGTHGKAVARLDKMEGTQAATGTLYYITLI